jgi:putative transposase
VPPINRRSLRLPGYDYTQPGAYFVTMVTQERAMILGKISDACVQLSPLGMIVEEELIRTQQIRPDVEIDAYIIMPNHIHAIFVINENSLTHHEAERQSKKSDSDNVGAHSCAPLRRPSRSLGSIIAGFKSVTTKRCNILRQTYNASIWQRSFHEHIVRSEADLNAIRAYIEANPLQWGQDRENPDYFAKNG